MVDINDDAKAGGYRRVEVLTGLGRRRKWSVDDKARIVEETLWPGTVVADVARRWQVSSQLVFTWRREMRRGPAAPQDFVATAEPQAVMPEAANLHLIGEDTSEMLNLVPAQLRVKVIRRPRYGCRTCAEAVVQAPAPERPIDGGMATEALVAHVLVSKFADHLPLYRKAQILARQGVNLDRSTLGNRVGRA